MVIWCGVRGHVEEVMVKSRTDSQFWSPFQVPADTLYSIPIIIDDRLCSLPHSDLYHSISCEDDDHRDHSLWRASHQEDPIHDSMACMVRAARTHSYSCKDDPSGMQIPRDWQRCDTVRCDAMRCDAMRCDV